VRAQQGKQMRRVGALIPSLPNDPQVQIRNAAFLQALEQAGWTVGQNLHIDYRWSAANEDDTRKYAMELVTLAPDVIFASAAPRWHHCVARHAPYQLCSLSSPIQWAQASWTVWHVQAVTSQASRDTNMASAQNGLSCSNKLPRM
jgi:putative ABC transport system substrate-binding protein